MGLINPATLLQLLVSLNGLDPRALSCRGRKGKTRGGIFAAKPKLTTHEILDLLKDYETPGCCKPETAEQYGISTSSAYRLDYEHKLALSA